MAKWHHAIHTTVDLLTWAKVPTWKFKLYKILFHVSAIFTAPFNSKWKETKRFAVQALKNTGFGTPKSEEKIIDEVEVLMKYLEDQKEAPFDPKTPIQNTTSNSLMSILLNVRYPWDSDGLKRIKQVNEDFFASFVDGFNLAFIHQYIPLPLMKIIWGKRIKECRSKDENMKRFIREQIEEHKTTFDSAQTRDFLDIYLAAGKDETMDFKTFVNTIAGFFPDGTATTTDALNWVFLFLASNPDDQKAAQKQLDEVK